MSPAVVADTIELERHDEQRAVAPSSSPRAPRTTTRRGGGSSRRTLRAVIAVALLVSWSVAALTGVLLWLAPHGRGAGQAVLLLGYTRRTWGDLHTWTCFFAVGVTIVHLVVDWKQVRACIRYLRTSGDARGSSG